MTPTGRQALRAHLQNTSLYEPRGRIEWQRGLITALTFLIASGLAALIALS